MSRRRERVANMIRNAVGQLLLTKLSDPRIDPALVSVTRVVVPEDLLTAKVYVSVVGTEPQQRNALRALRHAAGRIQELMMQHIQLQYTPVLDFALDEQFKKTLQTYRLIEQAMAEIRAKAQRQSGSSRAPQDDKRDGPG